MHTFDPETDICDNCGLSATAIEMFAVQCGQKWERRGRLLTTFMSGTTKDCHSINEAKRMSRKLQVGQLGYAGMRVIA